MSDSGLGRNRADDDATDDATDGDAERLAALERRVEALERALGTSGAAADVGAPPAGSPAVDPDQFWALTGLRRRVPVPPGAVLFTGTVTVPGGGTYEWQETRAADEVLESDWADAAAALAALANPVRLLLLREILHGTRTSAADLATLEAVGTSGQVYHHLSRLTAAGWLRTAARGRYVVPPERVVPLLTVIAAATR